MSIKNVVLLKIHIKVNQYTKIVFSIFFFRNHTDRFSRLRKGVRTLVIRYNIILLEYDSNMER